MLSTPHLAVNADHAAIVLNKASNPGGILPAVLSNATEADFEVRLALLGRPMLPPPADDLLQARQVANDVARPH